MDHKGVLIALAAVVTGTLGVAISVFAVNKMASFVNSFKDASGHVKTFASDLEGVVARVKTALTGQNTAAATSATKMEASAAATATAAQTEATAVETSAGQVEAANATAATSFGATATAAEAATATIGTAEAATVAEVTTADATIEAENAAASASFVGPAGLAVAAVGAGVVLGQVLPGSNVSARPGSRYSGYGNTLAGRYANQATAAGSALPLSVAGLAGLNLSGLANIGTSTASVGSVQGLLSSVGGGLSKSTLAGLSAIASSGSGSSTGGSTVYTGGGSGGGSTAGLLAKGQPLTSSQKAYANRIIQIGRSIGASPTAIAAVITEGIAESNLGQDMGWNSSNPTYGGLLAGSTGNFAGLGSASSSAVTDAEIMSALKGGRGYVAGGAEGLARSSSDLLQIAMTNSGSGTQFLRQPGHGAYAGEARSILAGLAGGSSSSGGRTSTKPAVTYSSYVNPFAGDPGVAQGRTDMGVDYSAPAGSKIGAIGAGTIVDIVKNWYKGQSLIEEQLTSGPKKGQYVYYAEQLKAAVKQGQAVRAGQKIATVASSGTGLELGFGAPGGQTLAQATTGYTEGQITKAGLAFERFMTQIKSGTYSHVANTAGGISAANYDPLLAKQQGDLTSGLGEMSRLVAAIHTHSLTKLDAELTGVHGAALGKIEMALSHDHSSALAALGRQLVAVHADALKAAYKAWGDAEAAAAAKRDKEAQAKRTAAEIKALNKDAQTTATWASAQAKQIADTTKVYLDKQAEAGLTGAALTAAQAQTSMDQITQVNDAAIDAAQAKVDAASGGSKLAQAQAGDVLARAQATATVQEAQAQSVLDKATAAANASTSTSSTTNSPTVILQINGTNLSPASLLSEIAWSLKTGTLPTAVAVPA